MVKVTIIFDNKIASPMLVEEFVKVYYLTAMANEDIVYSKVEQKSNFKELEKNNAK